MSGRRASDWLAFSPKRAGDERGQDGGSDRRGDERRAVDRRAPKRRVDPLFVATLLNQIVPDAASYPLAPYPAQAPAPRAGVVTDFSA
jgi:hypothetical protein